MSRLRTNFDNFLTKSTTGIGEPNQVNPYANNQNQPKNSSLKTQKEKPDMGLPTNLPEKAREQEKRKKYNILKH